MAKNLDQTRLTLVLLATSVVMFVVLPFLLVYSHNTPFVYSHKWLFLMGIAYLLLSLLSGSLLMQYIPEKNRRFTKMLTTRDRLGTVIGMALFPLICSGLFVGMFPLLANKFADKPVDKQFTYLSTEPFARPHRGLVELTLVDGGGVPHDVVFAKERALSLKLKCGDTLATTGRDSWIGYVIDSEVKVASAQKPC